MSRENETSFKWHGCKGDPLRSRHLGHDDKCRNSRPSPTRGESCIRKRACHSILKFSIGRAWLRLHRRRRGGGVGLGLHDHQHPCPFRPATPEAEPEEEMIGRGQPRSAVLALRTATCCRRATSSSPRSCRERMKAPDPGRKARRNRIMSPVSLHDSVGGRQVRASR
jgi:hypothetical protein